MEPGYFVFFLVLLVVAIAVFSFLFPGESLQSARGNFTAEPVIFFEDGRGTVEITPLAGTYEYDISVAGRAFYQGSLPQPVEVVPVLTFEGVSRKAQLEIRGEVANHFPLSEDDKSLDARFFATLRSLKPETIEANAVYQGPLMQRQSVLLETSHDRYLVTLDEITQRILHSCRAEVSVECALTIERIKLDGCSVCESGQDVADTLPPLGDSSRCAKCSRNVQLCEGTVTVTVPGTVACPSSRLDEIEILAQAGRPSLEDEEKLQPGYRVRISFWKNTQCVQSALPDQLPYLCLNDLLGGDYTVFAKKSLG